VATVAVAALVACQSHVSKLQRPPRHRMVESCRDRRGRGGDLDWFRAHVSSAIASCVRYGGITRLELPHYLHSSLPLPLSLSLSLSRTTTRPQPTNTIPRECRCPLFPSCRLSVRDSYGGVWSRYLRDRVSRHWRQPYGYAAWHHDHRESIGCPWLLIDGCLLQMACFEACTVIAACMTMTSSP